MKFNLEAFKNREFVINCQTCTQAEELEQILARFGLDVAQIYEKGWFVKEWKRMGNNSKYTCYAFTNRMLMYDSMSYYEQVCHLPVYTFSELFSELDLSDGIDNVNHPSHYQGKYECIEMMVALFGRRVTQDFCKLNWFKYHFRHKNKNGEEDLKKAQWYKDYYNKLEKSNWFELIFKDEDYYKEVRQYAEIKYKEYKGLNNEN